METFMMGAVCRANECMAESRSFRDETRVENTRDAFPRFANRLLFRIRHQFRGMGHSKNIQPDSGTDRPR